MTQTIYLFCKGNVTGIPPVYNYALCLASQGKQVHLICGEVNSSTKNYLASFSENITVDDLNLGSHSRFKKNLMFRKLVNSKYSHLQNQKVWFCTFDTAIALYKSDLYNNNKFILSVLELYDSAGYHTKFFLRRILKNTEKIVVPEYNRACIMKVVYKLKKLPLVYPNKPYFIELPEENPYLIEKIRELKSFSRGRKIILYQGLLTNHRNLDKIVAEIKNFEKDFVLVLMGPNIRNYVESLKNINESNLLYLGDIEAPFHLHITKLADIGILKYDFIDLNNIFCAPNKIWEYSAFKLALLGNNIPGLSFLIDKFNAGVVVDFEDENEIRQMLIDFHMHSDEYKEGSVKLFNSVDLEALSLKVFNW